MYIHMYVRTRKGTRHRFRSVQQHDMGASRTLLTAVKMPVEHMS